MPRLLHLTDLHLYADPDRLCKGRATGRSFQACLTAGLAHRPDHILVGGDLTEDHQPDTCRWLCNRLNDTGLPWSWVPGNHDDNPEALGVLPPVPGVLDLDGWSLVHLDTRTSGPHGELDAVNMAQLAHQLAAGANPCLVALHHPPHRFGHPWMDAINLRNGAALLDLLSRSPRVRGVLSGHGHTAFDREVQGVRCMTTPATCFQYGPDPDQPVLDDPPGYRVLDLQQDGSIQTKVYCI
jgi:Icc protein